MSVSVPPAASEAQVQPQARGSARRRILDTASALFYGEGIRAVGIDRIIAEAGVAKATFYHHFPAKDDLVRAYLQEQSDNTRRSLADQAPELPPLDLLVRIFEMIGDLACGPGFRGCAFINAAAEYPDPTHPVRTVIDDYRRWFRGHLRDLLIAAGHPDADRTADILMFLRDGLLVGGELDDRSTVRTLIRESVTRLVTAPPTLTEPPA